MKVYCTPETLIKSLVFQDSRGNVFSEKAVPAKEFDWSKAGNPLDGFSEGYARVVLQDRTETQQLITTRMAVKVQRDGSDEVIFVGDIEFSGTRQPMWCNQ